MNAFCTGCSFASPMPSTVVTDLPAAARAGIRQLTTGAPSTSTVQAPQTPAPQTSLVPRQIEVAAHDIDEKRVGVVGQESRSGR